MRTEELYATDLGMQFVLCGSWLQSSRVSNRVGGRLEPFRMVGEGWRPQKDVEHPLSFTLNNLDSYLIYKADWIPVAGYLDFTNFEVHIVFQKPTFLVVRLY